MTRKLLFVSLLCMMVAFVPLSCSSDDEDEDGSSSASISSTLSVTVTDIDVYTATISVSYTGTNPPIVMIAVEKLSTFTSGGYSTDSDSSVASFVAANGSTTTLPLSTTYTGLSAGTAYICAVSCYDSKAVFVDAAYAEFTTGTPEDDEFIGTSDNAGSIADETVDYSL